MAQLVPNLSYESRSSLFPPYHQTFCRVHRESPSDPSLCFIAFSFQFVPLHATYLAFQRVRAYFTHALSSRFRVRERDYGCDVVRVDHQCDQFFQLMLNDAPPRSSRSLKLLRPFSPQRL